MKSKISYLIIHFLLKKTQQKKKSEVNVDMKNRLLPKKYRKWKFRIQFVFRVQLLLTIYVCQDNVISLCKRFG